MSKDTLEMFVCDRCDAHEKPRKHRNTEDDDGLPFNWAKVTFRDGRVNWMKDLCNECADDVGAAIRGIF
jgi:hypothetical protein